jgi:hypothetical protein
MLYIYRERERERERERMAIKYVIASCHLVHTSSIYNPFCMPSQKISYLQFNPAIKNVLVLLRWDRIRTSPVKCCGDLNAGISVEIPMLV